MLTKTICPQCQETVAYDDATEGQPSCPNCSSKLEVRRPDPPKPRPSASPSAVLSRGAHIRALGENLEPTESVFNLSRTPAPEASFGGQAARDTEEFRAERARRQREVEAAVAKTQARSRRRRTRLKPWVKWTIFAVVALAVGIAAGATFIILR